MGKNNSKMEFGTKAVHGGKIRDEYGSLVTPIYLTTSYIFDDVADGAKKCESHDNGHCYTRISNPTQDAFEQKIAELEGGEAALAFASGTAAVSSLLLYKFQQGDHAVVDNTSYSSTQFLFDSILRKFGVETTFVDMSNIENLKDAIKENTKMIFFESPANPTLKLVDIEAVAKIGKEKGIMTAIDNTFASPYIQNPLKLGIDVVMHSATKYICGHGDAVAGVLVGTKKLMDEIRDYSIKNIGAIISPFNSYLLVRGLKTLSVRMQKHCSNAMAVAEFLEKHPKVDRVYYPGLPSHPQHELAKKQMRDFGAIICFN